MDAREVRLRCIEAAAKTPMVHANGQGAGVLAVAQQWAEWVLGSPSVTTSQVVAGGVETLL